MGDCPALSGAPQCNHGCPTEGARRGLHTHRGAGHVTIGERLDDTGLEGRVMRPQAKDAGSHPELEEFSP